MFVVGFFVQRTGRFAPIIWAAVPVYCLAGVFMNLAQELNHSLALLVFSQVLMALSRASFEAVKETALLSTAKQSDSAMLLAILSVSDKVGGMLGSTVADILWAMALPNAPRLYLTAETIFSPEVTHPLLEQHLSYPLGSPRRLDVERVYKDTQRTSLIIGCVLMALAMGLALLIANESLVREPLDPEQLQPWHPGRASRAAAPESRVQSPAVTALEASLGEFLALFEKEAQCTWLLVHEVVSAERRCQRAVAQELFEVVEQTRDWIDEFDARLALLRVLLIRLDWVGRLVETRPPSET